MGRSRRTTAAPESYDEDHGLSKELLRELNAEGPAREEPLIQSILGRRRKRRQDQSEDGPPLHSSGKENYGVVTGRRSAAGSKSSSASDDPDDFEYLVKWRNKSYLHVEWIERDMILQDVDGARRLNRFLNEQAVLDNASVGQEENVDYFDPAFVQVERIVDVFDPGQALPSQKSTAEEKEGRAARAEERARENEKKLRDQWTREAMQVLSLLQGFTHRGVLLSQYFLKPVDPVLDGAPDYFEVIKEPMDFSTIQNRLVNGRYGVVEDFARDVRLIFSNCKEYNKDPEMHVVFSGEKLSSVFEKRLASLLTGMAKREQEMLRDDAESGARKRQYLVKWHSLSYGELSWEDEDNILDDDAIAAFFRRNQVPSKKTLNAVLDSKRKVAKYETSPTFKNGRTLRSYQLEGLNWLVFNHAQGRGCILADEMGLGKTCQTVSFCHHLRQCSAKPCLVVAPLSTLGHWKNEFAQWTDLNAVLYHDGGTRTMNGADGRKLIRDYEFFYWRTNKQTGQRTVVPGLTKFHVLITSYESFASDAAYFADIPFECVIVDEGHRLKSRDGKLSLTLRETIKSSTRVILTGTPLQNNVRELFNLLNFCQPDEFSDEEAFLDDFGDMKDADQVALLQQRIRPFMLRRLKEHVEKDIPAKEETVIDVELTTMQKKYYRAIFERNRGFLSSSAMGPGGGGGSQKMPMQLTNIEMELRKCCNHPFLIAGARERESTVEDESSEEALQEVLQSSGKMILLDKLLAKLRKERRKVLIFSQFKIMLDIIEDYCRHPARQFPVERIDGDTVGGTRQRAIDRYSQSKDAFVFLLSTRAGGVGINLTAADTVIIYCSDWNPMNDLQAMARCHRIGQTSSVKVYRFVTKNTYESHLFATAAKKLGLEQAVLGNGDEASSSSSSAAATSPVGGQASSTYKKKKNKEEIEQLLKYGAYKLLEDDDAAAERAKEFSETDIDDLLKRESRTVNWDKRKGGGKDAASSFSASLSKASFVAAGSQVDIDVTDPSFWTKVLGQDPRSTLVARLSDGSAYESDEVKLKFFSELREVGGQVIEEKLSGNVKPEFEPQVIDCLRQITNMKRTFSDQEREAAEQLLKQVERPSRRAYNVKDVVRFFEGEVIAGLDDRQENGPANSGPVKDGSDNDDSGDEDYKWKRGGESSKKTCMLDGQRRAVLSVRGKEIDPELLRSIVNENGGYNKTAYSRNWMEIWRLLGFEYTPNAGYSLHRVYKRYFKPPPVEKPPPSSPPVTRPASSRRAVGRGIGKEPRSQAGPKYADLSASDEEDDESDFSSSSEEKRPKKKPKPAKKRPAPPKRPAVPPPKVELLDPAIYTQLTAKGEPWCRYCGATQSSGWSRGPWGSKMLCIIHYVQWHQKQTLSLKKYAKLPAPEQPIDPHVNTQFKYLLFVKEKEAKAQQMRELYGDDDSESDGSDGSSVAASNAAADDAAAAETDEHGRPIRRSGRSIKLMQREEKRKKKMERREQKRREKEEKRLEKRRKVEERLREQRDRDQAERKLELEQQREERERQRLEKLERKRWREAGEARMKTQQRKQGGASTPLQKGDHKRRRRSRKEQTFVEPPVQTDYLNDICAICTEGGELIICEGPCMRGFHMSCLDDDDRAKADSDDAWFCGDCEHGCYTCFTCRKEGLTNQPGGVISCAKPTCGRFSHLACVKNKSSRGQVLGGSRIMCPLHICANCSDSAVEPTVFCVRCDKGFHTKCLDRQHALRLHLNMCVCPDHFDRAKDFSATHDIFDEVVSSPEDDKIKDQAAPTKRGRRAKKEQQVTLTTPARARTKRNLENGNAEKESYSARSRRSRSSARNEDAPSLPHSRTQNSSRRKRSRKLMMNL